MMAENGVAKGDFGEVFSRGGEWSSAFWRSVKEVEERRSVTAEVAVAIGLMEASIWDEL